MEQTYEIKIDTPGEYRILTTTRLEDQLPDLKVDLRVAANPEALLHFLNLHVYRSQADPSPREGRPRHLNPLWRSADTCVLYHGRWGATLVAGPLESTNSNPWGQLVLRYRPEPLAEVTAAGIWLGEGEPVRQTRTDLLRRLRFARYNWTRVPMAEDSYAQMLRVLPALRLSVLLESANIKEPNGSTQKSSSATVKANDIPASLWFSPSLAEVQDETRRTFAVEVELDLTNSKEDVTFILSSPGLAEWLAEERILQMCRVLDRCRELGVLTILTTAER